MKYGLLHQETMRKIKHGDKNLWYTDEANALGQITSFTYGDGAQSIYEYDERHLLKSQTAENIQNFAYAYDIFANLAARTDNLHGMTESFEYDYLNRLEKITLNGTESIMGYDEYGRICSKQAQGHDVFSDATYDDWKKPHAIREATVETNPFDGRSQVIQYTMFNKVASIRVQDGQTLSYHYGYDHQRIKLTEIDREGPTLTCEKTYLGNCEFWNTCLYGAKSLTYLSGPMGVFAVVEKIAGGESLHYIYKDHLGSWTTITDGVGDIEQEASFDAWGNIRSASDWTSPMSEKLLFDRGYTSHEHLYFYGRYYHPNAPHTDLSLINMNGRMYDPIMSSFLSVDNYVQSPDNSQNFNRYAYCLNNPLKYTDPDGEWVQYVVGGLLGAINGYSIGKAAGLTDWNLAWSTIGGAAVGAISGGVGTYMTSVSTAAIGGLCGGAISGAGNGLIQGLATNSETLGADVWNGLWKGGVSGLVGGYVGGGCGLYGGKGAFLGGMAGSLTNELCNFATIDGYKINGWNVLAGGAMSFGVYHAQVGAGYLFGGFKGKLSYNDFCKMMSVSQKSMREWKEGRFIAYSDDTKAFSCMGDEYSVGIDSEHLTNAKLDYHTHAEWPENLADYDLMSTSKSAQLEGLQPNQCDEASRVMLTKIGCEHMYQGSRNGSIVYMTNKILPQTKVSICLYQQIRVPYNYSSIFHYYQHQYVFKLKH